jgi:hypothetical protein
MAAIKSMNLLARVIVGVRLANDRIPGVDVIARASLSIGYADKASNFMDDDVLTCFVRRPVVEERRFHGYPL